MVFGTVFERFVAACPACVMFRAMMEHVFAPPKIDGLFHQVAVKQYERELLFSTLVDLVSQIVTRTYRSVHAAYVKNRAHISVSVKALYDKLSNLEPGTSRALVQHTAREARELVDRSKGTRKPLLKGYRVRILDGNHLGKSHHRLEVLRDTAAGALPGQTLVLLDPERMIIDDVLCCEDGHAQERSLLTELLPSIAPGDLVIDDRNFCTLGFLFALMYRKAYFITRQHGRMPWKPLKESRFVGHTVTGRVYEQLIELIDPETGETRQVRRITVNLKSPTRDGDKEIHLLTNLAPSRVSATKVAELYRKRWTLEQAFNELTTELRCELQSLGYPKAALFGFCVAVCCYNVLAAVKGAIRGTHGEKTMETKVSNFFLTDEISGTYRGMMIALPPKEWEVFQTMSKAKLAAQLCQWARGADLGSYPKHPRGPKKPKNQRPNAQFQHVSTAKLLEKQREREKAERSVKASP
jgi:Transposase DDE domain